MLSNKVMLVKNLLKAEIDLLKTDIQESINTDLDTEQRGEKDLKIIKLETLIDNLKELCKKEKYENECKKVVRESDNLAYHLVKNKPNSMELMKNIKDNREKADIEFIKTKEIEDLYKLDSEEFPSYLFFHKKVIDSYSVCPFIHITKDNIKEIIESRKHWLQQQHDNGKIYYNMYDKICLMVDYDKMCLQKMECEEYFENIHKFKDDTTGHLVDLFNICVEYLIQYIDCNIKTKRIKDKFKIIINNLSIIYTKTGLNVNEFLSIKYNLYIPVNDIGVVNLENDLRESRDSTQKMILEHYKTILEQYKSINENLIIESRYVKNTLNNCKQSLYDYILKKNVDGVKKIRQTGKYFKKWSLLNTEEKNERFVSFIENYISNYLVLSGLIQQNEFDEILIKTKELITTAISEKKIKYKNIKWNLKMGYIEKISNLKYNDTKKEFYLEENLEKVNQNVNKPKSSSIKTIFIKQNEKIINEELLLFIINFIQSSLTLHDCTDSKKKDGYTLNNLKDDCLEHIKSKLKIKRLSVLDKTKLKKRFDEVYFVIKNNRDTNDTNDTTVAHSTSSSSNQ